MTIEQICELTKGKIVCGKHRAAEDVAFGFASDLMSDVLTLKSRDFILITGLSNIQSIRTAEMSDIEYLLIGRDKKCSIEMIELGKENNMVIVESPYSVFKCAGILYQAGLQALY